MRIQFYLKQLWHFQEDITRRRLVFWAILATGLLVMAAVNYPTFTGDTLMMTLTMILFATNSLIFFTTLRDDSRIKDAMLVSLVILDLGCLFYYYLISSAAIF